MKTKSVLKFEETLNILEEAVGLIEKRKNEYDEEYNNTNDVKFKEFSEIVSGDIEIIRGLEKKYGLISDKEAEVELESNENGDLEME